MRALLAILVLVLATSCDFPTAPESLNDGHVDTGWDGPTCADLGCCMLDDGTIGFSGCGH